MTFFILSDACNDITTDSLLFFTAFSIRILYICANASYEIFTCRMRTTEEQNCSMHLSTSGFEL